MWIRPVSAFMRVIAHQLLILMLCDIQKLLYDTSDGKRVFKASHIFIFIII